jgi:hypothetical protein
MYSKEQIINEIKRVAGKLGVQNLKAKDFEINSTIPLSTLKYYLGSWKQALLEAKLDSKDSGGSKAKLGKGSENELLRDLIRLYDEYGETPTIALIQKDGKYNERLYTSKWKSVNEAFTLAKNKFLKKENIVKTDPGEETKVEHEIPGFMEEDMSEERIDKALLDRDKTGEILDREKTEELRKGKAPIEDPIDFNAMIDEIEKEERELAEITQAAVKEKNKGEKAAVKSQEEEHEDNEMDPNEITKVQEIMRIPLKEKPAAEGKDVKKKPTPKKDVDFSDIGLDEVLIKAGEDEPEVEIEKAVNFVVEDDNTKEIKVDIKREKDDRGIGRIPRTIQPGKSKKKRKEVGEPINFRGLRHAPLNEDGVLYLFGLISHELGFLIESIKPGFPAGEGKRCFDKKNNRWEHMYIDFEYKSSQFKEKGHDEDECDLVVCWIHDWQECPVEILEMRSTIKYLTGQKIV